MLTSRVCRMPSRRRVMMISTSSLCSPANLAGALDALKAEVGMKPGHLARLESELLKFARCDCSSILAS